MLIGPPSNDNSIPPPDDHSKDRKRSEEQDRPRGDIIEISESGRGRLAEIADAALRAEMAELELPGDEQVAEQSTVRKDKIDQARRRMLSGYYDQKEIKQLIADRLIDDIDS